MSARVDAIVVGAGVVGLAVARALAQRGLDVVVLEAEGSVGNHASSRNSEVIHAGIYYTPGGLKAELCLAGKRSLYAYCRARQIGHRAIGKFIVANSDDELATLEALRKNAEASGLADLQWRDAGDVHRAEPQVRCRGALWSPSTGIIDSHALVRALDADAREAGAQLALRSEMRSCAPSSDGLRVEAGDASVHTRVLVNAAGLGAQNVASRIESLAPEAIPARHMAKGSYFTLPGSGVFRHLVYPVPTSASLGIHVTLDLAGTVRFGPDQEWVDAIDYTVDPERAPLFEAAVREYYPGLRPGTLQPGYAGIRAKVQGPGDPKRDFVVSGPADHGVRGLVNLFGIESPGLTAALALAELVCHKLDA